MDTFEAYYLKNSSSSWLVSMVHLLHHGHSANWMITWITIIRCHLKLKGQDTFVRALISQNLFNLETVSVPMKHHIVYDRW